MTGSRTRGDGCLSDLQLDLLAAAELAPDDAAAGRRHVDACAACAVRLQVFADDRAAFRSALPARTFVADAIAARAPAAPHRWWWLAVPALSAAALAALLVLRPHDRVAGATRIKGGDHLGFYVERDGVAIRGVDNDDVHPGERIRFTLTTRAPAHVAIGSVDDAGRTFVYYPVGSDMGILPAGADQLLPDAIELDDSLGREQVFAWFCDGAIDAAAVRAALAAPDRALDGCRTDSLTWQKQERR